MKSERIGLWLSLLANLGVIVGLALLVVDLRHSTLATQAALYQESMSFARENVALLVGDENKELSSVVFRGESDPDSLSPAELKKFPERAPLALLVRLLLIGGGENAACFAYPPLMTGLEMEEEGGFNPYRFGMIGASDGHNASSPVEENAYTGKIGFTDGTPEARILPPEGSDSPLLAGGNSGSPFSAAGLAGIWAEANTREDLFDAIQAREVFVTSGPRIRVRLLGG